MIFYTLALCFTMSFLQASTEGHNQRSLLTNNAVSIEELVQQPRFLKYLSIALSFTEENNQGPLSSVNTVISVKELAEQTFFSKYLPFHDQLNNRTICKGIKNHTFENQIKKDMQFWIKHSCRHLSTYSAAEARKEFELFSQPGTLHKQALDILEIRCCRRKGNLHWWTGEIIDSEEKNSKIPPVVDANFPISEFEAYTFLKFLEESYTSVEITSQVIIDNQLYTQYLFNKHQRSDIAPKINTFLSFLFRNKDFSIYITALRNFTSCDLVQKQQYRNICEYYLSCEIYSSYYCSAARNDVLDLLKNNIDVFYELFHRHIVDKYIRDKEYYTFEPLEELSMIFKKNKGRYYHKLFNEFFKSYEASEKIIEFIKGNQKFKNIQQEIAVEFLSYEQALKNVFSEWAIQTLSPYSFLTFFQFLDICLIEQIYNQKKDMLKEFLLQQDKESLVYFSKELKQVKNLLSL